MSHGKIREEKDCLNCGHTVEERFCPYCGQENTEARQPFYYLFTHFIEDFTHYDGQFWKTIKYLLFRPGKLTKEYIAGKRQLYVAPVKLYIFISFITFLLPGFLPSIEDQSHDIQKPSAEETRIKKEKTEKALGNLKKEGILTDENVINVKKLIDTIESDSKKEQAIADNDDLIDETLTESNTKVLGAENMKQYDSLHQKNGGVLYLLTRPFAKKTFELKERGLNKKQIKERFVETFSHTLPKALFVYLPIFAFFLWLFHNKKKWWYFDHGIFTLHYFSFLLLGILIFMIKSSVMDFLPDYGIINFISTLFSMALTVYLAIYFFVAHHRVYETKKRISIFKGSLLFIINSFGLMLMLIGLLYISFLMIH
ncbi:DUF3667 domain-containing protein [Chryseobacterium populi]|uniref:DUF3667 domain-containing protein n=1 Tax=Chryseobacterium populi TaxID=1144316 RepID=J3CI56_9FLAO|nr:DUF3667 domain-containing protein [Chryseobacterium populi]EJL72064.1 Protein of unknown function (DUF3667) [Chryseobacterium populi]